METKLKDMDFEEIQEFSNKVNFVIERSIFRSIKEKGNDYWYLQVRDLFDGMWYFIVYDYFTGDIDISDSNKTIFKHKDIMFEVMKKYYIQQGYDKFEINYYSS